MKVKIVIGVVAVVAVAAVVVAVVLLTGGDDNAPQSARDEPSKSSGGSRGSSSGSGSQPALRTVIVKRGRGKNATAQAGALIRNAKEIWIRVSAAPKQQVRATWSLACGGGTASQDNYLVTPPHQRQLELPKKHKTCAASVAAQLQNNTGRVKVALLRER